MHYSFVMRYESPPPRLARRHVRAFSNPAAMALKIALVEPRVIWDLEIHLQWGIPLPDWLEDKWLASSLQKKLETYTIESPIELDLASRKAEDGKPPPPGALRHSGALRRSMVLSGTKACIPEVLLTPHFVLR